MRHYIIPLLALTLLQACAEKKAPDTAQQNADSTGKVCLAPSDRNPNGASELAQLMRTMEQQTELWKTEITENKPALSPVPDAYKNLKLARVTDPDMKNENYNAFADDFIAYSNALTAAVPVERKTAFNTMVGGCMACHTQMCPGPVKRINKFYFE